MIITDILWMAFLFLIPGMASFTVYRHVAGYAINKLYKFIFYSAIWSIIDYGIFEFVYGHLIFGIPFGKCLEVWKMFQYKYTDITINDILRVLVLGILIAWGVGLLTRGIRLRYKGLLYTKLWDYYLNFLWKKEYKVAVYDYKNKCKYIGKVRNFSYFNSRKELVLQDVEMYSFTKEGKELKRMEEGKIEEVYLQLEDSSFTILNLGKTDKPTGNGAGNEEKLVEKEEKK